VDRSSLQDRLEIVLRCLKKAFKAHGLHYQSSETRLLHRDHQCLPKMLYHVTDGSFIVYFTVDFIRVAEKIDDTKDVRDD
jgi:hypothetical protein